MALTNRSLKRFRTALEKGIMELEMCFHHFLYVKYI